MERWLLISDTHWDAQEELHPSYKLVKKFAETFKPDKVAILGDLFDFAYIAKFNQGLLKTISGKTFIADYGLGNKELDFWQKTADEVILFQGNHDRRVDIIVDKSPILEGMIEVENGLHLDERGIKYYKEKEQPVKFGNLYMMHGFYTNIYHARKTLEAVGGNVVYGHVHKMSSYIKNLYSHDEVIGAWSLGTLNSRNPYWLRGKPSNWQNGFAVMYMKDNGNFNLYPIIIIDNSFIFEGTEYKI